MAVTEFWVLRKLDWVHSDGLQQVRVLYSLLWLSLSFECARKWVESVNRFYIRSVWVNLILMDPCIADYSVEIPTRCSFVIEFIIPSFLNAQHVPSGTPRFFKCSTCFERYTAHYQEL